MESSNQPVLFNIDEQYKIALDKLKEKLNANDPENIMNRLEWKYIYILSIVIALKRKFKPKKSKKKVWIFRTDSMHMEDHSVLKSLIFSFSQDLTLLLPEKYAKFYELSEELANAGMEKTLELLNDPKSVEKKVLLDGASIPNLEK